MLLLRFLCDIYAIMNDRATHGHRIIIAFTTHEDKWMLQKVLKDSNNSQYRAANDILLDNYE
jgi:hypothetical protein